MRADYKAEIAKRFKVLRRKARMTQATLGRIIGICRQSVSEIENRRVMPHYTTLSEFSDLEERHESARRFSACPRKPSWT
jgi:DNA-binding XRE family transcriptional regulator